MNEFLVHYAYLIVPVIKVALLVFIVLTVDAYLTWLERKVIAHIQARWGPHRVGPHGLLQPLADGLKFIFKEDPDAIRRGQSRVLPGAILDADAGAYVSRSNPLRAAALHGVGL